MKRAILNSGPGAWAFEEHAYDLARALWVEVVEKPADLNFVLAWPSAGLSSGQSFVPWDSIVLASDKRLQATAFSAQAVPSPATHVLGTNEDLAGFLKANQQQEWVLKFPTGCGAKGHQLVTKDTVLRDDWPRPFVVQEFIRMERPEVYRLYGVDEELFGWNARRFPSGSKTSPWVAHAQGARYVQLGRPPQEAMDVARLALKATGLFGSFGAVDLLPSGRGWLALEVGTDGLFNHVDRDFDSTALKDELDRRLAEAFWSDSADKPWGTAEWSRRPA